MYLSSFCFFRFRLMIVFGDLGQSRQGAWKMKRNSDLTINDGAGFYTFFPRFFPLGCECGTPQLTFPKRWLTVKWGQTGLVQQVYSIIWSATNLISRSTSHARQPDPHVWTANSCGQPKLTRIDPQTIWLA